MATVERVAHHAPGAAQVGEPQSVGCFEASWSPEIHDLYGDAETILSKMDGLPMELGDRRVYALMVEGPTSAEVRFFEQVDPENWAILSWQGGKLGDLPSRLDEVVLKNRGIHCVGEQVKALLTSAVKLELQGIVPAPASARAAFAHPIRAHSKGEFVRASAALLC